MRVWCWEWYFILTLDICLYAYAVIFRKQSQGATWESIIYSSFSRSQNQYMGICESNTWLDIFPLTANICVRDRMKSHFQLKGVHVRTHNIHVDNVYWVIIRNNYPQKTFSLGLKNDFWYLLPMNLNGRSRLPPISPMISELVSVVWGLIFQKNVSSIASTTFYCPHFFGWSFIAIAASKVWPEQLNVSMLRREWLKRHCSDLPPTRFPGKPRESESESLLKCNEALFAKHLFYIQHSE